MSDPAVAVVGMSGGVDSSVAAHLALQTGCRVIGVMLQMKAPSPERDADEAAFFAVARQLGIEAELLPAPDFQEKVIRFSAEEYQRGRTPNPCCICNQAVKFARLLEFADAIPGATVWTGHYAKMTDGRLFRGADRAKDQSYFLYRLPEAWRKKIVLPLGVHTKSEVRAMAESLQLEVARRPDSQDVCFGVSGECCGETLRRLAGFPEKIGYFLYRGKIVGSHRGIHRYTLGQRSKLGVALGVPAYIAKIDAQSNDITLETDGASLDRNQFFLDDVFLHETALPQRAELQIRYRSRPVFASLREENGRIAVTTEIPVHAVTPGQAGVFYLGNRVAGGGTIALE
ncbi:MAG: tRNA 2-thiouridine(34) synthase MnmA [Victivallaceae bacterium]|nr:tRNA 2-thiouridine(34) synthase MnmA [Victivallaceae bacterium]